MSTISLPSARVVRPTAPAARSSNKSTGTRQFACAVVALALVALLLAGWCPLGFSIVTVFLFAGPHNWLEARYFVARMPARWGALRGHYLTGIAGVLSLTIGFTALPYLERQFDWSGEAFLMAVAAWNTVLVGWICWMAVLRSRQNPRRSWPLLAPLGFMLVGLAWLKPLAWDLGLVYLHPLVALAFLDRELASHRAEWRRAYRLLLAALPLALAALWWRLADAPSLPGADALTSRITAHAGGEILTGVSNHLLVATHTFLEMLHYGVWLVAIPLVSLRTRPWQIAQVPLARRSAAWRTAVAGLLLIGGLAVVGFWAGFLADYPRTRDLYFTVAMLHVLAEVPFLLRLL
jgi:hypothetical protein